MEWRGSHPISTNRQPAPSSHSSWDSSQPGQDPSGHSHLAGSGKERCLPAYWQCPRRHQNHQGGWSSPRNHVHHTLRCYRSWSRLFSIHTSGPIETWGLWQRKMPGRLTKTQTGFCGPPGFPRPCTFHEIVSQFEVNVGSIYIPSWHPSRRCTAAHSYLCQMAHAMLGRRLYLGILGWQNRVSRHWTRLAIRKWA